MYKRLQYLRTCGGVDRFLAQSTMSLGFKGPLDLTLQLFQIAFFSSNDGQAYFQS